MRFVSLGSGSRGNATLIESGETRLLLDCGFTAREAERRLGLAGVEPDSIDAILVTHEHQDHIRGVGVLARRYGIPVWLTHGSLNSGRLGGIPETRIIRGHQGSFDIGSISISPYPVPHDAREPVQFVFQSDRSRLGVLTDTGTITPHIVCMLESCTALLLECNHDPIMLANGPYPYQLQKRVGGQLGHLSNRQAAELVGILDHPGLDHLVAAHLSEKNNTVELASEAILTATPGMEARLTVTGQDLVSGWFEL